MEDLKIGRRWIDPEFLAPAGNIINAGERNLDASNRRKGQFKVKVDPFVMIVGDLVADSTRSLFPGCLSLTLAVGIAASVRPSRHEVLFARYAPTPQQRADK